MIEKIQSIFSSEERRPDYLILLVTLCLLFVGTVMIYSSSTIMAEERFGDSYYFLKKQLLYATIGLMCMFVTWRLRYHVLRKAAYAGVILSLVLLMMVFIPGLGVTVNGASRWIRVAGLTFQVTEFVKLAMVLFLAHFLTKKIEFGRTDLLKMYAVPVGITLLITLLVLSQPDFGTAVIFVAVLMALLFLSGMRIKHLIYFAAAMVPAGVYLILCEEYRLRRFFAYLHPWDDRRGAGFHIIQSFLSFGSGGLFGMGLGNSAQKLFFLPEPHTDFILSIIGEECGFVGVMFVIALFAVLLIRGFWISLTTDDTFGSLLAAGITTVLAIEVSINIAVVMGMLPTKGLVLPFVSYGGTSLVMSLSAVGLLLNISGRECVRSEYAVRQTG